MSGYRHRTRYTTTYITCIPWLHWRTKTMYNIYTDNMYNKPWWLKIGLTWPVSAVTKTWSKFHQNASDSSDADDAAYWPIRASLCIGLIRACGTCYVHWHIFTIIMLLIDAVNDKPLLKKFKGNRMQALERWRIGGNYPIPAEFVYNHQQQK